MATYVYNNLGIFTDVVFDPLADVVDFSGSGLSAAEILIGGENDDELALSTSQRELFLFVEPAERVNEANFIGLAGGSKFLIGDNSSAWRDDELAQTLNGGSGNDLIAGMGGNDLINAGGGDDRIYSFIGFTDILGSDTIDGGTGIDTLFLVDEPLDGVVIDASLATGIVWLGGDGILQVSNVENLVGSAWGDNLVGDALNNFIDGGEGDDTLSGGSGNDTLIGGEGNDSLSGGDGNDLLRGRAGIDTLAGGAGDDVYSGVRGADLVVEFTAEGNDTLRDAVSINITSIPGVENIQLLAGAPVSATGNAFANLLTGNANDNFMEGGAGDDTLDGGAHTVADVATYNSATSGIVATFTGAGTATVSDGLGGTDSLIGVEAIFGGSFDDSIAGGSGDDVMRGNAGHDTMDGGAGFDTASYTNSVNPIKVNLGSAPVTVNGTVLNANSAADGFDSDTLTGGIQSFTDTLSNLEGIRAGSGSDILSGSAASDRIEGYAGTDTLIGGAGNDTLDGHVSVITFLGGGTISALLADSGIDEVRYTDAQQGVSVNLGLGTAVDGIDMDAGTVGIQPGTDTLISIEFVAGSSFADSLVGGNPNVVLTGLFSDPGEFFEGGAGADTIDGGDHNGAAPDHGYFDTVSYRGDVASVIVNLGAGPLTVSPDTIAGGTARDGSLSTDTLSNIDRVWGSEFDDYLRGGSASTNLSGTLFEAFAGFAGDDTIDGEGGIDRVEYAYNGVGAVHVQIDASTGTGTAFNDGQGGVDTLFDIESVRGSLSATGDTLTGGAGNESFEGRQGNDTIDGGSGTDTAQYNGSGPGVTVNLSEITVLGLAPNSAFDGFGFVDTLISIENAVGSDFSDTLIGEAGQNNVLDGRGGARFTGNSIGFHIDTADYTGHNAINVNLAADSALDGSGGTDTLRDIERVVGGAGNDTLLGSNTALEYTGRFTDRSEIFRGAGGFDSIDGGSDAWGDFDSVDYSSSTSSVNVSLGMGSAVFDGIDADGNPDNGFLAGSDTLANIDGVIGSAFDDTLTGGSDSRTFGGTPFELFTGGGGNDLIQGDSGFGPDSGFDFVNYRGATGTGILVNLSFESAVLNGVTVNPGTVDATGVGLGIDTLWGIEGVRGSQGNDSMLGGEFSNFGRQTFEPNAGADFVDGGGDYDVISYQTSPTSVYVHLGYNFALDGWGSTDTFVNIEGASGGDFDDTLIGGGAFEAGEVEWEEFEGRGGDDLIDGADGFENGLIDLVDMDLDAAAYRNAPAAANVNLVTGIALDGYGDTDTLVGVEFVYGSRGDDTLTGGNAVNDRFEGFEGRAGNDLITGGTGSDFVFYEESPEGVIVNLGSSAIVVDGITVQAGTALDGWIVPGATQPGTDTLSGIEDAVGGHFDDFLAGSADANLLFGGEGSDTLAGGAGNDQLTGEDDWRGLDRDIADYRTAGEGVVVNLATGTATDGLGGSDTLVDIEGAFGGAFADRFIGNDDENIFMGGAGADTLDGGAGTDYASYRDDGAAVTVDLANQTATDGTGATDTFFSIEAVYGSDFNDTLTGSSGNNYFDGGDGNDVISGGAGIDRALYREASGAITVTGGGAAFGGVYNVTGAAGTDSLSGIEIVVGSAFADLIDGRVLDTTEREFLQGNGGDDTIHGGATGMTVLSFLNEDGSVWIDLGANGGNGSSIDNTLFFNGRTLTYRNIEGIVGGNWNDSVTGSAGNDYFQGGAGADTFSGGAGFDVVAFTRSPDPVVVNLSSGSVFINDYVDADGDSHGNVFVSVGQALDGFSQGSDDSSEFTLDFLSGVESVEGSDYNDSMFGGFGMAERFDGGAGDDVFSGGGGVANDTLIGGEGRDRVNYGGATPNGVGVVVDLALGTASKGANGSDTLVSIENIGGTAFNDTLRGTDSNPYTGRMTDVNEFYFGGAGNDSIDGADTLGGSLDGQFDIVSYDQFSGISSGVIVNLAAGTASGSGGNDTLANIDMVIGSSFADIIAGGGASRSFGGTSFEQFRGGAGNDTIDGAFGEDRVDYSLATAPVTVTLGNGAAAGSAVDGQGGVDVLRNVEAVRGSNFGDVLTGGGTHNVGTPYDLEFFEGMEGNDTIDGLGGHDRVGYQRSPGAVTINIAAGFALDGFGTRDTFVNIEGAIGSDFDDSFIGSNNTATEVFRGGAGNDTIDGAGGGDIAAYNQSPDAVHVDLATGIAQDGYGTTDTLINVEGVRGTIFVDTLLGGSGNDTLEGWAGADSLVGGAGQDAVSYNAAPSGVVVNLATATYQDGYGTSDLASGFEDVIGSHFADSLTGDAGNNLLRGSSGGDTLDGGAGDDTMEGGLGDDTYFVDSSADVVVELPGDGFDTVVTSLQIDIPANVEKIKFSGIGITGNAADNVIEGVDTAQTLGGGDGSDTVSYVYQTAPVVVDLASGTATEQGGSGEVEDTLFNFENAEGGQANDTLIGTSGSNTLDGRAGSDSMQGGSGADTYIVDDSADQVIETDNTPIGSSPIALDLGSIIDQVIASIDFTLGNFLENLELAQGAGNLNGIGNALDNVLKGNQGNNALDGGAGTDTASYAGAAVAVLVSLASASTQSTGAGDDTLANFENLTGSAFDDTLGGSAGDNILDGGTGSDTVSYAAALGAVSVSLEIAGPQATGGDGSDTLISIENLTGSAFNDSLAGNAAANVLDGGAGSDTVTYAAAGAAVNVSLVSGGAGDTLVNIENLTGSAFDDTLAGTDAANVLDGAAGTDTVTYTAAGAAVNVSLVSGGAGDTLAGFENLIGSAFNDTLGGTDGANVLDGGAGTDTVTYAAASAAVTVSLVAGGAGDTLSSFENLTGSAFNDSLTGDGGANVLDGGAGADTLDGGAGIDTASYASAGAAVTVGLGSGGEGDTLINIENLAGSAFNDALVGSADANTIAGLAGNDNLDGGAGIDTADYSGATGAVTAELWLGTASNDGQGGADTLIGIENLAGGAFNDLLVGDDFANSLSGNGGDDRLLGGAGADSLIGDAGNDTIGGNAGNDTIDGGDGIDTLDYSLVVNGVTVEVWLGTVSNDGDGGADTLIGIENVFGTQANDLLVGTEEANTLFGNTGDDSILGGGGADSLLGEGGNDTLGGNAGDDTIDGGAGIDTVDYSLVVNGVTVEVWKGTVSDDGQSGADTLIGIENVFGTQSNDLLVGTEDANTLFGNTGNDSILGGGGNDSLLGQGGNDTLGGNAGNDTIDGGDGIDTVDYSLVASGVAVEVWKALVSDDGQGGGDTLFGIENVFGTQANDLLVGTEDANSLFGNTGNDSILGGGGNDSLLGEGGDDTLGGNAGNDTINGGDGIDTVDYSLVTNGVTVEVWLGTVSNDGDGGADTLIGIENVFGTQANDLLVGTEDANRLFGNTGNDSILGGGGADSLLGEGGDDTIGGNAGNDTIDGGAGIDTADYSGVSAAGVTVNLLLGTASNDGQGTADTLISIENAFGAQGNDVLTGSDGANAFFGNTGDDSLSGAGGEDSLRGQGGSDTLSGGSGADSFVFESALGPTNVDQITDFVVADDTIQLYNQIFTSFAATGGLPAGTFVSGAGQTTAVDGNDFLIYDNTTGALYYDADGSNSGSSPVQFATLIGLPALTDADFVVI